MIGVDRDGLFIGTVFCAIAAGIGCAAVFAKSTGIGVIAIAPLALAVWVLYFFRDPRRFIPPGDENAVSAADGRVVDVSRIPDESFPGGTALRIAVFMNVFDVHINRSPLGGAVVRTTHRPGKKLNAMSPRAALENEFGDTELDTPCGPVRIRQIAGLVARRVVTRVAAGDAVGRGGRIGLIRFGSRVDVFLPNEFQPVVKAGDRVRSGETVIAQTRRMLEKER